MVTTAAKQRSTKNGARPTSNRRASLKDKANWPSDIEEAYERAPGPYTIQNALHIIGEEYFELFNGWLVEKAMTDSEERRIAGIIQEILSLAARALDWGQAYPDQFECKMFKLNLVEPVEREGQSEKDKYDVVKPDVCLLSHQRFETLVEPAVPGRKHLMLRGGPELAVELRSPSNRRTEEHKKRTSYFANGTLIVWDVAPEKRKIWVYEANNPDQPTEYGEEDEITCEQFLPGWKRKVADFFTPRLSAEQIVGQQAEKWRNESEAKGRIEGRIEGGVEAAKRILLRLATHRFGVEKLLPDLETRLGGYTLEQLTDLADTIATSPTLEDWLATFS